MAKPAPNTMPTKPIGSVSRPVDLIERIAKGDSEDPNPAPLYEVAIRDTIERFEATSSPVVTDGEQRKYHNCYTHRVHGLPNTESLLQSTHIETPEEVRDRSFEPGKNWSWTRETVNF